MDQGFDNAVRRIVEARRALTFLEDLPAESQPPTLADAYRMQRAVIERWDDEIAGWKVGTTSKYAQDLFGISAPVYGPVFRKTVVAGPAILPAKGFHHLMLETEFAFRFGQDLPPVPLRTPGTKSSQRLMLSCRRLRSSALGSADLPATNCCNWWLTTAPMAVQFWGRFASAGTTWISPRIR